MQLAHRRRAAAFQGPRDERSRGAVLVEAAFVTPIFFMLVLGILEVGLAMNDNLALAHTVRAGTRVASASGNDSYADYGIIQAIKRESAALGTDQIDLVVVYRASRIGEDPPDACKEGRPQNPGASKTAPACNVYRTSDFDRPKAEWSCDPDEDLDEYWCPRTRVVIRAQGPEYVGVWMQVTHRWVTGMFGRTATLTDQSVIRLEPRAR